MAVNITSTAEVYVKEGMKLVHLITADQPLTDFAVVGGVDSALFMAGGGFELRWFEDIPKYTDTPEDVGANNVYNVQIEVTDLESMTATQNIAVYVQRVPVFNPAKKFPQWDDVADYPFSGMDETHDDSELGVTMLLENYFDEPVVVNNTVYVGLGWAARYLGSRSDSQIYLGAGTLR